MTATRFALSSALVLTLSAFLCNAQRAPPEMTFGVVNLQYETTWFGTAECVLNRQLSQESIEQSGNGQLYCFYQPALPEMLDCAFSGAFCEHVKDVCDSLDGQITNVSDSCSEIGPSEE